MILATDLGSTNLKAALFTPDGRRIGMALRPLQYSIRTNERAELDCECVQRCIMGLVEDTAASAGVSTGDIKRISITSQAQTFCICDGEGCPVSPLIGWTDARASAEAKELLVELGQAFHRTTGIPSVSPLLTISKVLWWKRRHGLPADARVVFLPSHLAMLLGARQVTDFNLAAMSGLYSITEGGWWQEALDLVGVTAVQMGDAVAPGVAVPTSSKRRPAGFSPDLEIVLAGNDHTAGAVGCGCAEGRPILTLGTAGVLYRIAGQEAGPYASGGLWGPYPGGGHYELLCLNHAGSALDWADEYLFGRLDSPQFVERAKTVPIAETLPLFNPRSWGSGQAWVGEGTCEEKAYAVLEGIAFALRNMAGDHFSGKNGEMLLLGGGSRLDFWVQLVADVFDQTLVREKRDGLDGVAVLAGVPMVSDSLLSKIFSPSSEKRPLLEARFARWRRLFAVED